MQQQLACVCVFVYTVIPHFIVLFFIAVCGYCAVVVVYKLEACGNPVLSDDA